jgi:hypothetical protein
MVRRIVAAVLIVLGASLAYWGIWIAIIKARFFFEHGGVWLGPEPEWLIPMAALLIAALLWWLGVRLWRQQEHV